MAQIEAESVETWCSRTALTSRQRSIFYCPEARYKGSPHWFHYCVGVQSQTQLLRVTQQNACYLRVSYSQGQIPLLARSSSPIHGKKLRTKYLITEGTRCASMGSADMQGLLLFFACGPESLTLKLAHVSTLHNSMWQRLAEDAGKHDYQGHVVSAMRGNAWLRRVLHAGS